ncbi:hypothetical protein [Pyruvatibacter mobilis]|jgi:hypothetical protein|uniref:hypothetical protein n=1 Tax=Pyruvatibacter mobilis TaxID=1712261 RepID=UPI000411D5FA
MYAILAVTLHLLSGPDVWVVTDAGTFKDKAACEAEVARSVPAKLKDDEQKAYEAGALQYVCLRVIEK